MRIATGAFGIAVAAALLQAGVAVACPTPPEDCADATELVVTVIPPTVEAVDHHFVVIVAPTPGREPICDSMALFTLDNLSVRMPGANGGSDVQLSDIRISRAVALTTKQSAARYGSGAFCLWAAEAGEDWNQRYEVTVVARDPQGNAHRGAVTVEMVCGATSGTTLPTVEPKTCDQRCIAEVPPPTPVVDCTQCEAPPVDCNQCPPVVDCSLCDVEICCGSGCPEGSYCPDGVSSGSQGVSSSAKLGSGGCSTFPGAGSWLGVLAMLGASLALRRRPISQNQ